MSVINFWLCTAAL